LAADGYRVAVLARRLDRITALADELGNGSIAIEPDVTDRVSTVAAADRVRHELGSAGVLINNAGVMLLGPFDSAQREDYRQMIEVNLLGAITTTEVFLDQINDAVPRNDRVRVAFTNLASCR